MGRMRQRVYHTAKARYGDVLPWYLRWSMPPERPMLMIVGRRGSGKTLLATKIALERMRAGEVVYANYPIRDERSGNASGYLHSLVNVVGLTNCTVVIDEANLWCASREWNLIPAHVRGEWAMSRKVGVSFIFTTQHESRVDVIIRELVDWVLICDRIPFVPRWLPFFRYARTYLEEIAEVRRGKVYKGSTWVATSDVMASYDTRALIDASMLEQLAGYNKCLKDGLNPAEHGYTIPEPLPPLRRTPDGTWQPFTGDTMVTSEDEKALDLDLVTP